MGNAYAKFDKNDKFRYGSYWDAKNLKSRQAKVTPFTWQRGLIFKSEIF